MLVESNVCSAQKWQSSTRKTAEIQAAEAQIARLRARQAQLVGDLDEEGIAGLDGCRSINEWVTGRIDVSPETARDLIAASRGLTEDLEERIESGEITFDRALLTAQLKAFGTTEEFIAESFGYDLSKLRRLISQYRRFSPRREREVFEDRYLTIQPNLDESAWRVNGTLPGIDGHIVD